jgi:hypothetical protein
VPHRRRLSRCDLAILWNGSHPAYAPVVESLRQRGAKLLFVELGWHPQRGTIQIDPVGINARASWAEARSQQPKAPSSGRVPLSVKPDGDLLVVLQLDRDTQITQLSPWFANMRSFVEFVCRHSALPVRLRAHPREQPEESFRRRVMELGGRWDESPSLAVAMAQAKALACINSSCGVEALAVGLPVLCYGQAIYRENGAVLCLDNDPAETRAVTEALSNGECDVYREVMETVVHRILANQWSLEEIAVRLPPLLTAILGAASGRNALDRTWFDPLLRWTRDRAPRLVAGW